MRPIVDILLATHNGEKYILEQLESLGAQTFRQWRLVVIDDASTDNTVGITRSFVEEHGVDAILLQAHAVRRGTIASFSELIERFARDDGDAAPYAALCDQDDTWHPRKLEYIVQRLGDLESRVGSEEPLLVHSDLRIVDAGGELVSDSFWRFQGLDPSTTGHLNRLLVMNVVTGCAMALNRALARLSVPVPPEAQMHDWWLAMCVAAFGMPVWIHEPLVDYRQHATNALGAKRYRPSTWIAESIHRLARRSGQDDRSADVAFRRAALLANVSQACAFRDRFEQRLTARQANMLHDYCRLYGQPRASRALSMVRNGFWRTGYLRNVGPLVSKPVAGLEATSSYGAAG